MMVIIIIMRKGDCDLCHRSTMWPRGACARRTQHLSRLLGLGVTGQKEWY